MLFKKSLAFIVLFALLWSSIAPSYIHAQKTTSPILQPHDQKSSSRSFQFSFLSSDIQIQISKALYRLRQYAENKNHSEKSRRQARSVLDLFQNHVTFSNAKSFKDRPGYFIEARFRYDHQTIRFLLEYSPKNDLSP